VDYTRPIDADEKPQALFGTGISAEEILAHIHGEGKKTFNPLYLFFISVLFFSFAGAFSSDKKYILMAVPVLFLHECGHLLAMKLFRYKNTRILFIPFLGALTTGMPQAFSRSKETLISLAGPVFGTLTGVAFLAAFRFLHQDFWLQLATFTFILNGLNLLPIAPLDGGRVVETLITSRHPALDIGYRILSILAFIAGAIKFQDYALGIMAYFSAILIWSAISENRAIASLRASGGLQGEELGLENVSIIFAAIQASYPATQVQKLKAKTAAGLVSRIHQKLNKARTGWLATTGLLFAYALALGVAVVFAIGAIYMKRRLGIG
jgi:Zn-dependent protease